jgi:hypothetical protein
VPSDPVGVDAGQPAAHMALQIGGAGADVSGWHGAFSEPRIAFILCG